jgi:hypothetical protein
MYMDMISCLLKMNNLVKRGYISIRYYVSINKPCDQKQVFMDWMFLLQRKFTWLKGDINGWNFLFTNNKSRG